MITLELSSGAAAVTVTPAGLSLTRSVCNENLRHQEQSAVCSLAYEPGLLALLALNAGVSAVIKDGASVLFTGICNADLSWEDRGAPLPVEKITVTVRDNTYKLNRKTAAETALINTTVAAAVQKLCQDCGVAVSSGTALPQTEVRAFVIDKNASYLAVLDALLSSTDTPFILTLPDTSPFLISPPSPLPLRPWARTLSSPAPPLPVRTNHIPPSG
jgi:hypothetical protein